MKARSQKNKGESAYDERLNPEKFQEQLNYISALEKETKKIV
jgi:hypothetical protein